MTPTCRTDQTTRSDGPLEISGGVTMGYKAVYLDEAITAHLAFVTRRRALRPTEEYASPPLSQ